ncbi:hypothetical protein ACJMK2_001435, partial [Sinanodonta woodiana]
MLINPLVIDNYSRSNDTIAIMYCVLTVLDKLHQTVLNRCLPNLMRFLNVRDVMMYIQEHKLFDDVAVRDINQQKTSTKAISLLIDQVKLRGQDTYERFKECLILTNQADLKQKLDKEEDNLAAEMKDKQQGTGYWNVGVLKRDLKDWDDDQCGPPCNKLTNKSGRHLHKFASVSSCSVYLHGNIQEICKRYFGEIRSYLKDKPTRFHLIDEDFAIDNTVVDRKLEDLKKKIVEVASQQEYWGEKIPARWILLEQELMRRKNEGVKVISLNDVEKINKEGTVPIEQNEELNLFLRFLHETGTIIYFSIDILRENILLDPTWLIDALKTLINADSDLPEGSADSLVSEKWSDFKGKGILCLELIDAIWTKEKYPELYTHKEHMLLIMEQLNIIAKPRAFSEIGEKIESYFLTPCMLRQESPIDVISPEPDPLFVSTPILCCVFTGKFLPPPIFHRLIAACVTRWPVAKKKGTSENLIFCGCCIFDLDLFHRLTLHCKNHIVFARITRLVVDGVKTPDAKLCTRVRKFITLNLSKITSYLGQNLQYELCTCWSPSQVLPEDGSVAPFQMFVADEGHDSDAPIIPEHMNHARLYVALVTVCTNALRDILLLRVPSPYTSIYKAIRAKKADLTKKTQTKRGQWLIPLLNSSQCQVVFPDPFGRYVASVDQFDISLLYILIRHVSTVSASLMGWGNDPIEQPFRDRSLGASVKRIRLYRNDNGHSMDGKLTQKEFNEYWSKIDAVLDDTEVKLGRQGYYRSQLEQQRRQ